MSSASALSTRTLLITSPDTSIDFAELVEAFRAFAGADIGVRVAYAMNKAGVEPTEVSLNCYKSGKRVALEGMTGISKRALGLTNQYENLLSVECTKYNTRKWDKSKRRAGDKKIRIILQQ